MPAALPVLGVLIGGSSSRMGSPKARLLAPGGTESLVERWLRLAAEVGLPVVLVGAGDSGLAEGSEQPLRLRDQPKNVGPLGGLSALLTHAQMQNREAIAVACDMPYVSAALLHRLASDPRAAAVLAARAADGGKWQPLFARYSPSLVRPVIADVLASGRSALQAVLERMATVELRLSAEEQQALRDWDTPEDIGRDLPRPLT